MKVFKIVLGIICSIEVLLFITIYLSNPNIMYAVLGIIFAFLAFWSFKSARKQQRKEKTVKELANSIADGIYFSTPDLTEQQLRDLEAAKEKERTSPNPKFHRTLREDNLSFNFEEKWGARVEELENAFEDMYSKALKTKDWSESIKLLKEALLFFERAKKFCYSKGKGGQIYFQDMWEHLHNSNTDCFSYEDEIHRHLDYYERLFEVETQIYTIITAQSGQLLQKDIYSYLPTFGKGDIQKALRHLESNGKIIRKKHGSTYLLSVATSH